KEGDIAGILGSLETLRMESVRRNIQRQTGDEAEQAAGFEIQRSEGSAVESTLQGSDARAIDRDATDDGDVLIGDQRRSRTGDRNRGGHGVQHDLNGLNGLLTVSDGTDLKGVWPILQDHRQHIVPRGVGRGGSFIKTRVASSFEGNGGLR